MPELPEVETTRRGIEPHVSGHILTEVVIRNGRLRQPVSPQLADSVAGSTLLGVRRRGKYLLLDFDGGTLIIHLGMSGSLRMVPRATPVAAHDHIDLCFGNQALRYRDPRRFGLVQWTSEPPELHPLLAHLGIEPLAEGFSGPWLHQATRGSTTPIKLFLMDGRRIVGIGNIYASEALFRARIHPTTPAGQLGPARSSRLVTAIRETLTDAIQAGGSSLRDFVDIHGQPGYFQQSYFVYGRTGEACRLCGTAIRKSIMGQRATFHCPRCQRPPNPARHRE